MYTIYVDDALLYSPERAADGYVITAGKLTREVNKADSLDITVPGSNPGIASLVMMGSKIVVFRDNVIVFIGRALTAKRGLYDLTTYHCEGGLAYFNDIKIPSILAGSSHPPKTYFDYLYEQVHEDYSDVGLGLFNNYYIPNYVPHVHSSAGWYWDSTAPENARHYVFEHPEDHAIEYYTTSYLQRLITLQNQFGGTVVVEYRNVKEYLNGHYVDAVLPHYYAPGTEPLNAQVIEFGKNLLDIAQTVDYSKLATVYCSIGFVKVEGKSYCAEILLPSDGDGVCLAGPWPRNPVMVYIPDKSAVEQYGFVMDWIEFDLTEYHDRTKAILYVDETVHDYRYTAEGERLRGILLDQTKSYAETNNMACATFECKAIDRSFVDNTVAPLCVGQRNRIISQPNGIDTTIICNRTEENLVDPTQDRYTFGTSASFLAHMLKPNTSLTKQTVTVAPNP